MSYGSDPDQDQHSVGPDLGPNCLQRLSADDKIHFFANVISTITLWAGLNIVTDGHWMISEATGPVQCLQYAIK